MTDAEGTGMNGKHKTTIRLKRCNNEEGCIGWIDRDSNAARNIAYIGYHIARNLYRPPQFMKPKKQKLAKEKE